MKRELRRYPFGVTSRLGSEVYLVKRGPRPDHHKAPFHPVIVCSRKHTADWEAGWTGDGSWVWTHGSSSRAGGWLLTHWNGLLVNYGHVVRSCVLPDGTTTGFDHSLDTEPWTLIRGAVWWSDHSLPAWLEDLGVVLAEDDFTVRKIQEDDGDCLLSPHMGAVLRDRRRIERAKS